MCCRGLPGSGLGKSEKARGRFGVWCRAGADGLYTADCEFSRAYTMSMTWVSKKLRLDLRPTTYEVSHASAG